MLTSGTMVHNIPPNGATTAVVEVWGREFVQTWVSHAVFVPFLLTPLFFSCRATPITWCRRRRQRGAPRPQFDWMPICRSRRREQPEQQLAKRRAVAEAKVAEKKRQEAEAEKARQAAQSAELKKAFQVSLRPSDREDDARMSEVSQVSAKRKRTTTITVRTTFSGVSAFIHFRAFY